jgi:hypothetical protein
MGKACSTNWAAEDHTEVIGAKAARKEATTKTKM